PPAGDRFSRWSSISRGREAWQSTAPKPAPCKFQNRVRLKVQVLPLEHPGLPSVSLWTGKPLALARLFSQLDSALRYPLRLSARRFVPRLRSPFGWLVPRRSAIPADSRKPG